MSHPEPVRPATSTHPPTDQTAPTGSPAGDPAGDPAGVALVRRRTIRRAGRPVRTGRSRPARRVAGHRPEPRERHRRHLSGEATGRPANVGRRGRRPGRYAGPRPAGWLAGHRYRPPGRPGPIQRAAAIVTIAGLTMMASAGPALAEPPGSLNDVINRIRAWLVGIAASLATLFLTYGAVRYLSAGGDPGAVEKARTALRSAAIGYGLALLAPLAVTILKTFVS
jgi:Type IV secretion system pilin